MRSRNIKPDFFKDVKMSELSFRQRLLFAGLWCLADREGRFEWEEKRIKIEVFPYDEISIKELNGDLTVIQRWTLIRKYEVNGKWYGEVKNFKKHQSPHSTEKQSIIPEPPIESISCLLTVNPPLDNGEYPSDSLIPDSLIPDSLIHRKATKTKDEEFIEKLKRNPAYSEINIDNELAKMDAWLLAHPRRIKNKRFIVNWLNKIDISVKTNLPAKHGGNSPYSLTNLMKKQNGEL